MAPSALSLTLKKLLLCTPQCNSALSGATLPLFRSIQTCIVFSQIFRNVVIKELEVVSWIWLWKWIFHGDFYIPDSDAWSCLKSPLLQRFLWEAASQGVVNKWKTPRNSSTKTLTEFDYIWPTFDPCFLCRLPPAKFLPNCSDVWNELFWTGKTIVIILEMLDFNTQLSQQEAEWNWFLFTLH